MGLSLLQVERYAFNIVENGASFNEQVEVDVDEQTEVFRVPQHNNVGAMDVMNDFEVVSLVFSNSQNGYRQSQTKELWHEVSSPLPPLSML